MTPRLGRPVLCPSLSPCSLDLLLFFSFCGVGVGEETKGDEVIPHSLSIQQVRLWRVRACWCWGYLGLLRAGPVSILASREPEPSTPRAWNSKISIGKINIYLPPRLPPRLPPHFGCLDPGSCIVSLALFFFLSHVFVRVLLCRSDWPRTWYVDQDGLELIREPPAFAAECWN